MNPIIKYFPNGNKQYERYLNDLRQAHNEFGPAIISYFASGNIHYVSYWIHGKLHNAKGPAYIYYYENGDISSREYWLNDGFIQVDTDEEFRKYINKLILS